MSRKLNRAKLVFVALACGGIPLVTTATCDPYTGFLDVYRDDDSFYYDGYYTDAYYVDYYDDCYDLFCY